MINLYDITKWDQWIIYPVISYPLRAFPRDFDLPMGSVHTDES